jgi:4-hydroxy-tetrahydrodipicolinate reductase
MPSVGVVGASGRLGSHVVEAVGLAGWQLTLSASTDKWFERSRPEVVIDASRPPALRRVVDYCAESGSGLVEAVSGLDDEALDSVAALGERVPVILAPNLAAGHHLQLLALQAALGAIRNRQEWKVSVTDRHPRSKKERPSATCRRLEQACRAYGIEDPQVLVIRDGAPVSDHSVTLVSEGETLTLMHAVSDLRAAARGAIEAARWLLEVEPGLWTMQDVWNSNEP